MEKSSASIFKETTNEFQNLKTQFEDFGNSLYERISVELSDKLVSEISRASA